MRVAAVVPVLDEAIAIGMVVRGLLRNFACCVLVVDGGSRDDTRRVATEAGAIVVLDSRRGYGRACLTGAERALAPDPVEGPTDDDAHVHDAIAFLDGDGSCDPGDLPDLVAALDGVDLVLGTRSRRRIEAGAMPWHARLGNALVSGLLSVRTGRRTHDVPPFKVIRRAALDRLDLDDEGYGWTVQLLARALADPGVMIRERPVAFLRRAGGVSKVSGDARASVRAGWAMMSVGWRESRSRPVVAMMAKAPGAGHAKTRLAVDLGEAETAELWAACLRDVGDLIQSVARRTGSRPIAMLARPGDAEPVRRILGPGWAPIIQTRVGLAGALTEVFLAAFDRGADRGLAVAGDAPALPPERLATALDVLGRDRRAAFAGPSGDGGYHLIGLRWDPAPRWWPERLRRRRRSALARRLGTVFGPAQVSGASAFDATARALTSAGWRVARGQPWPDIDTIDDLRRLATRLARDGRWAPRTAAWVRDRPGLLAGRVTKSSSSDRDAHHILSPADEGRPDSGAAMQSPPIANPWDWIYATRALDAVGWYEPDPVTSRALVADAEARGARSIIDIGGGASRLVDHLVDLDLDRIAVLDISEAGLAVARHRLGPRAAAVNWIVGNVVELGLDERYDVWHDRACFHFLLDDAERRQYVALAERTVPIGGIAIVATFADDGPERCSGMPVRRYDPPELAAEFGAGFRLVASRRYLHHTPAGVLQSFQYSTLERVALEPEPHDGS